MVGRFCGVKGLYFVLQIKNFQAPLIIQPWKSNFQNVKNHNSSAAGTALTEFGGTWSGSGGGSPSLLPSASLRMYRNVPKAWAQAEKMSCR